MPPDGDSQTVKLIEPNALDRAGFSVAENHRFSDEFGLHVSERGEDRGGAMLHKGHDVPPKPGRRAIRRGRVAFERCGSRGGHGATECWIVSVGNLETSDDQVCHR